MSGEKKHNEDEGGRLKDKVQKLASDTSQAEAGWRRIGAGDPGAALSALLTEIDETLLPREISFRNDGGDILRLEASGRRLRRFVGPAPASLGSYDQWFGAAISEPGDDEVAEIKDLLGAFLGNGAELWVQTESRQSSGDAGGMGASAAALAEAWSVPLSAGSKTDFDGAFGAFSDALCEEADAWVKAENGQVAATSDPGEYQGWIADCHSVDWTAYLKAPASRISAEDAPALCVLTSDASPAMHLLIAGYGAVSIAALVPSAKSADIAAAWRASGL